MKKTIVFIMVAMLSLPVTLADEVANETVSSESTSTSTTVMPSTPIIKQTVPQIIRTFLTAYWWIVLLIVIIIIYIPLKYNGIINLKNHRIQAFSDIDVQLKLRFDLVPNLVETVKGYASHEQGTLEKVIQARSSFQQAGNDIDAKLEANNQLMGALRSIFALSEAYPDLKANQGFNQLQGELSDIENKIAAARRFFNSATQEYNTYIEMFPANLVAKLFGFKVEKSYEVDEASRENVKVEF